MITTKEYNHNRSIEDFEKQIKIISDCGYKLIAVTQMFCDDVFVFETSEEAKNAYLKFESVEFILEGWWLGKEEFLKAVRAYEQEEGDTQVRIHWL